MPLARKVQLFGASLGAVLTQVIGLAIIFDLIHWTAEQVAQVGVTYTTVLGAVVVGAFVAEGKEPPVADAPDA
jgi:hypothetical protein